jgi:hypothetical protein
MSVLVQAGSQKVSPGSHIPAPVVAVTPVVVAPVVGLEVALSDTPPLVPVIVSVAPEPVVPGSVVLDAEVVLAPLEPPSEVPPAGSLAATGGEGEEDGQRGDPGRQGVSHWGLLRPQ